ncbi:FtsX-like permease family protein [Ilyomonas limi]|uniref:FtsX-like permease family protein n=1 Tax=Ilyomonas limi TaxID=2575867 RepID=A0A4U3L0B8_9BACT|nr:ABC transporter permease [Ilyomonas limi]TKK68260.1 FtsX-like permease family protein [Ilyomonas limi]
MIKNYLLIAIRNMRRYKFISFINLFGLTVGITCCLLISLYIVNELSYDQYNKNAENIYRVERTFKNAETGALSLELGAVAPPIGPLLQNDFKDIKAITSVLPTGTTAFRYKDKIFNEPNVYFIDENFFKIFDVRVTKGNPNAALSEPYSVMLTEEMAKKYFGNEDPIDKMVKLDQQITCKVTGIYKALPANAHLHPDIMLSFATLKDSAIYGEANLRTNWGNNSFYDYLLLPPNYDAQKLEAQFPAFLNRHVPHEGDKFQPSAWTSLSLRKLTDIHLYSHKDSEIEENGDIKRVYIFSAIALFILLIACINYMNLSTARSALRAKEIGVRKVIGAGKGELVAQFLSESVLVCAIATLFSFFLTWLALPTLNNISGQSLTIQSLFVPSIILPLLAVPFVVGILSGIYPAVFLSSFQPAKVLKGVLKVGKGNLSFRKVLVVTQFAISIILIISTAVVIRQLQYMQNKSLGFSKDQLVTLNDNAGLNNSFQSFKAALLANPNVVSVARSSRIPSGRLLDSQGSQISNGNSLAPTKADIKYVQADENFIPAYKVRVVAGSNFSKTDGMDTASFIINEAAVRALGLRSNEDAIGKPFMYGNRKGQIIGVINDFNFESLHQQIIPLVLLTSTVPNGYNRISIKVSGNIPSAIAHIEQTWKTYLPDTPFDYTFLDDRFDTLYKAEHQQQMVFSIFAGIAIFIACLGLFGLSAFTITQRVKEIGIRKVLGASVSSIVSLISKEFLLLVAVAAVIAFPVAWYAMHNWLQDFAYRTNIAWWIFIMAACIAILIALFTISIQSIKAALSNPVKSLRSE